MAKKTIAMKAVKPIMISALFGFLRAQPFNGEFPIIQVPAFSVRLLDILDFRLPSLA